MLKMMETKLTARLTAPSSGGHGIGGGGGGGSEGGGGGGLQQVLETQERLQGMQAKLEHQLQQLQAAQEAASQRHQGASKLGGRIVRLPPPHPPPSGGMLQQVLETQERLQGKLQLLQAAQEAASEKHQTSLDKVHALLGVLVAGAGLGAQRTPLPGEIDA
jgi:hypothetical protein